MRTNLETSAWKADLAAFGKRNHLRPTRLEVLGPEKNIDSDFWLEDGLLLEGIDLETDEARRPFVEIMLRGDKAASWNHMTHVVAGVKRMALNTARRCDECLEIEDTEGAMTILHFESESESDSER